MKMCLFVKFQCLMLGAILLMSSIAAPLTAVSSPGDRVNQLISDCPWIGMIAKEVTYGPITISHLNIGESGRLVFCEPGETIEGTLKYKINVKELDSWGLHHIVVGLRHQDAQSCISHSFGVWDRKGNSSFSFQAPEGKGVYELCFEYYKGALCSDAFAQWQNSSPPHRATIGIVVVD